MRFLQIINALCLFFLLVSCQETNMKSGQGNEDTSNPLGYVRPMLGVDGGNVFGGVSLPFSMLRLGPDVQPNNVTNGYRSNRPIKGFSHTHLSGTGGGPRYGNFLVVPQVGPLDLEDKVSLKKINEYSAPGLYQVRLARIPGDTKVRLTGSERVGFHEYEFYTWGKEDSLEANILIDVSHGNTRGKATDHRCTGGDLTFYSDQELSGWASFVGGWGGEIPYKVYFHAIFDTPFTGQGVWESASVFADATQRQDRDALQKEFSEFGAFAQFKVTQHQKIQLKVGISFISEAKAKANIKREIPHWDFTQTREVAAEQWAAALGKIRVQGGSLEARTKFYSMLRNTMIMPTDVTGENPYWESNHPHYWEHYCLWDVYRTVMPLHTLILPNRQRDILNSLLDIYDHKGWLPDAWIAGHYANVQGGSNADIVFADAIVKGLVGFDKKKALEAILKNGQIPSDQPKLYGRYLSQYLEKGYLTPETTKGAISKTMEYAYNDFCISQVARKLGEKEIAQTFLDRSKKVLDLFYQKEGFFWGKDQAGNWLPDFSTTPSRPDHWNDPLFYEGGSKTYSDFVPHAMEYLIALHGGPAAYEKHLDWVFESGFELGNEPVFLTPYLYNYLNKPHKTAERVRKLLDEQFLVGTQGLPGQDDSGAVSAWYVWSAMGLFPVAGQAVYLLGNPIFEKVQLDIGNGKTFEINTEHYAPSAIYVKGVKLNGKSIKRLYLTHEEIASGGTLTFVMSPDPNNDWAIEAPPSY